METRIDVTRTNSGYRSLRQDLSTSCQSDDQLRDLYSTRTPTTVYLLFIIFTATLGPFQFGYHLGELNAPESVITCKAQSMPTETALSQSSSFFPQCIPMSTSQWGMIQSIFTVGGLLGSLTAGAVATKHGRLPAMMVLTCALAVGSAIEAIAFSMTTLSFGRFVSGVGAGAGTVVCPIYISELSPPEKTGLFGALSQVMINAGILIAQVLGYFLSRGSLWRIILAFPGVVSFLTLLALLFAPETPPWLIENGRFVAARVVLHKVRGPGADIRHEMPHGSSVNEEQQQLLGALPQAVASEKQPNIMFVDVIRMSKYRRAVIAVGATFMAQQLTGINSIVMYSVVILGNILPSSAALITVVVSAVNLAVSVLCTPLPDKIGRKGCLLLSTSGIGTSSALLALGLSMGIPTLTVISLITFVASFAIGLGPVPFILVSEVVGPEAVGALSSWALAGNWISTFCVAEFFPLLDRALPQGRVYWLFTGVAVLFGMFIAWRLPESKGKAGPEEVWHGMEY